MIPKECKRLAEVDFPIAEVSRHALREKSIRHGHPSTLHLWWARRPLASSRAVLLALLWPDPCDPACPPEFKKEARKLLPNAACNPGTTDEELRGALLKFIGAFANWDLAANQAYLDISRALVKAAHGDESPLVVDPFAGGGSIPLEALRLGCDAFASDLNPVACLILKVLLEDIPRDGSRLADELRTVGAGIQRKARGTLEDLYPRDADGAMPIAYLWARTVRCESPDCGAELPLVRSTWLCKKKSRLRAFRFRIDRPPGAPPRVDVEIFEPKAEREVPGGTVTGAKATCVCCGVVMAPDRVRAQLVVQRGGADVAFNDAGRRTGGARMLAVVTLRPTETGRHYRVADAHDYDAVYKAQSRISTVLGEWERGGKVTICPVPDERLPAMSGTFNAPLYGMDRWGDLFTARQKVVHVTTAGLIANIKDPAVAEVLALCYGHVVTRASSLSVWRYQADQEKVESVFSRQALPMIWDFAESIPVSGSTGSLADSIEVVSRMIEALSRLMFTPGQVQLADASEHPLPDASASVYFTDPPYYFAVPYADLSDFFFVWLKRALPAHALLRDPFDPSNPLTPKDAELCEMAHWDRERYAYKDRDFFERGMARAFAEGRRVLREDGAAAIVFAHKTTEGWEALLTGMIRGGWTVTGSWPIATEMPNRPRARESAALATSVHLVCRPRADDALVGDWGAVLRELPPRVGDWMERMQREGVRGADLVFSCIGPALEIFSRYAKVETADGRDVALAEYLEKVWEVVGRSALEQVLGTAEAKARNGVVGAVEEDARLTALFLWTLQSTNGEVPGGTRDEGQADEASDEDDDDEGPPPTKAKGFTLVFDVVRRFAQPLGIDLPKWEGRVIETKKGVVRLIPITERAKQLFGNDGAEAVAARLEQERAPGINPLQGLLFPDMESGPTVRGRGGMSRKRAPGDVSDETLAAAGDATTLDRIHAAMLLQSGGRTSALRALLQAEQERGSDFLRLANALSALYPKASEEKRLLDAMLLAVPR